MGRRTVLTQRQRARFLAALELGLSRSAAAMEAGWSERSVSRWLAYGRDEPESVHGELLADILASEETYRQRAAQAEVEGPPTFYVELSMKHDARVFTYKPPGWPDDEDDEDDDDDPFHGHWRPTC